jgi:hypothetical protein
VTSLEAFSMMMRVANALVEHMTPEQAEAAARDLRRDAAGEGRKVEREALEQVARQLGEASARMRATRS